MKQEITLSSEQLQVLEQILHWLKTSDEQFLTIGGYAGTGKTTLISLLRKELMTEKATRGLGIAFCCYTGKAVSVLRQKLSDAEALLPLDSCSTIHSLIYTAKTDELGQIISWDRQPELLADVIIIDEGSMVSGDIWRDLVQYKKRILVFGDHGQLPPIESGFNLMQSPQLKLQSIVRQAEGNPIIHLSKIVREGGEIAIGNYGHGVQKYSMQDSDALEKFESIVTGPVDDYLCICGYNKTRVRLNQRIRALRGFETPSPERNDQVICLKNNRAKHIYNGMRGVISHIDTIDTLWLDATIEMEDTGKQFEGIISKKQFNREKTLKPDEEGGTRFESGKQVGDLFDFGYCLTVHKAQGSEARRVVLFEERMPAYDDEMWQRWLYTAITRAREELVIFGR